MQYERIIKVANRGFSTARPKKKRAEKKHRKVAKTGNPVHLLSLGLINPKRGPSQMATAKRKKKGSAARRAATKNRPRTMSVTKHRPRSKASNSKTRVIVIGGTKKKANSGRRRNRRRNPLFFGNTVSAVKIAEYVAGGLIGVAVNRAILPLLPSAITNSNLGATFAALAIAAAEWWIANMVNKDFGAAVGFGALMNAGSQALNYFLPTVGSFVSLQGVRVNNGIADFVPGFFTVPQTPVITDGSTTPMRGPGGDMMHRAYPTAYGMAA